MRTWRQSVVALATSLVLALTLAGVAAAKSPIAHSVSAGGPDLCRVFGEKPGCDASYTLTANQYADGSVSGQYADRWGTFGGFSASIDCLSVVGADAWVSGVITSGFFRDPETGERFEFTGPIASRVHDGTPLGEPDQVSFSWGFAQAHPCTDHFDYPLYEVTEGAVVVR